MRKTRVYTRHVLQDVAKLGVALILIAVLNILSPTKRSYSGSYLMGFATFISAVGVVSEDQLLALQFGVTRKTQWRVGLLAAIVQAGLSTLIGAVLMAVLLARHVQAFSITASWLPGMGQVPPTPWRFDFLLFSFAGYLLVTLLGQIMGIVTHQVHWQAWSIILVTMIGFAVLTLTLGASAMAVTFKPASSLGYSGLIWIGLFSLLTLVGWWHERQIAMAGVEGQ